MLVIYVLRCHAMRRDACPEDGILTSTNQTRMLVLRSAAASPLATRVQPDETGQHTTEAESPDVHRLTKLSCCVVARPAPVGLRQAPGPRAELNGGLAGGRV